MGGEFGEDDDFNQVQFLFFLLGFLEGDVDSKNVLYIGDFAQILHIHLIYL